MKHIVSSIIWLIFALEINAQNDGFEKVDNTIINCCRNGKCEGDNVSPFNMGLVDDWFASHGTPQINKLNCRTQESYVHSGERAVFMFFDSTNKEGIFRSFSVKKNESFTIRLFARVDLSVGAKVIVKLANGLKKEGIDTGTVNIPVPGSSQLVISKTLSAEWEEVSAVEIVADNDYSQLWIYGMDGHIVVDDVSTRVSCCEPYKIYQSLVNPPSTFVNDYIIAGRNVTSLQPPGDVEVNNTDTSSPTIFQAGNRIDLEPGFTTQTDANFIARILPCAQTPISIDITNVSDISDPCHSKYKAEACFGSGFYTYTWSEDVRSSINDPETKNIVNGPEWFGKSISVTVTDNITNQKTTKSVVMPSWLPFVESFDSSKIYISNVITPDGDGINDDWVVLDSERPNTLKWAYNAYEVEYSVTYGRYPELLKGCSAKKRTDKVNGFWDKYIFCSGKYICENKLTTLYYEVDLENCKEKRKIEGTITVVNCNKGAPIEEITYSMTNVENALHPRINKVFSVNPNPFTDKLNIKDIKGSHNYKILDINGKILQTGIVSDENNEITHLNTLANGMYYLLIENKVYKVIKMSQ